MRLNPTTILTPSDWLVDIRFRSWTGKECRRVIGVSPHQTEQGAIAAALRSLKLHRHPDQVIDVSAARRRDKPLPMERMTG